MGKNGRDWQDPMRGGLHQAHIRAKGKKCFLPTKTAQDARKKLSSEKPTVQFRSMAFNPNLKTRSVPQTNA